MFNPRNINSDKGITLTILVITIVVILILSGVTITAVMGDQGLINKSEELSNNTNETINQQTEELNNMINELDEIMNPWVQNKTVVTKKLKSGTKTYNVGDDYTYDCGVEGYTGGWKVLGAENGKLLIMSTEDIGTLTLNGKEGYNTGISQLDEMCASYGTNARSVTVEDINRVTGYDPNKTGNEKKFGEGEFFEYGNKVTYTKNGSTATNGKTNTTAISKYEHPDGRILGSNNITSITVKNTSYEYYPNTLTTNDSDTTVGIETTSVVYKLLFRNSTNTENCNYWLASSYVNTDAGSSGFGLRVINSDGKVYYLNLWNSDGVESNSTIGVRAVVPVD